MDRRAFLLGGLAGAVALTLAGCAGTLPEIGPVVWRSAVSRAVSRP
ncbi:hypothetical protein [Curtobacterium sp. RRHDQ10]